MPKGSYDNTLLRRVLRRVLIGAWKKVLRRVLRRCRAMGLEGGSVLRRVLRKGFEKGLPEGTQKVETRPLVEYDPLRRAPYSNSCRFL